uniref:Adducin 3 n=1 Tax=Myotis myotis TaxID=51298 RepID=A0A7J7TSE9_MYOMY|nr:adducin 3 [Myotis myotis]
MMILAHQLLPTPLAISQKENLKSIRRQSNVNSKAWKKTMSYFPRASSPWKCLSW